MIKYNRNNNDNELDLDLINKLQNLAVKNQYELYLKTLHNGLKLVKIKECGEPLLRLSDNLNKDIFINLVDLKIPVDDEKRPYLRKGTIERLNKAQSYLPKGYHLLIRDAFRTDQMVWNLYNLYLKKLIEDNPSIGAKKADAQARNFLAVPDDPVTPGHMTGGAVDVILSDDNKKRIHLEVDEKLIAREKQMFTFFSGLPEKTTKNRMILYNVMTKSGFYNYSREYWHYSYGDAYWAVRRKEKMAIYGVPAR